MSTNERETGVKDMDSETMNQGAGEAGEAVKPDTAQPDLARLAEVRARLLSAFGQVALTLASVPRYRHHPIADLHSLVLEPMIRDRVAIATKPDSDQKAPGGDVVGIAIWASVSETVNASIRDQIKDGAHPVRLGADDWTSGDIIWLLDVIAPSRRLSTSVLANFQQVVKDGKVFIHPAVARMVDPEFLRKMGAEPVGTPAPENAEAGL